MTQKIDKNVHCAMAKTKKFVLDTNILLHNPDAIENFGNNTIVISLKVLTELDKFKTGLDVINFNARRSTRYIDKLRKKNPTGALKDGVERESGGYLRIMNERDFAAIPNVDMNESDNPIIGVAYHLKEEGEQVVFVSKDINARIRADFLGIPVQDYEKQKIVSEHLFTGHQTLQVAGAVIDKVYAQGSTSLPEGVFMPNEFVVLINEVDHKQTVITRVSKNKLKMVKWDQGKIFGIEARSNEQLMALDLLLDPTISLVTLVGQAGTGKTLLAVAAALEMAVHSEQYEKVLFARAIIPMGKDIGFLPGSKEEKLAPWMEALTDSLEIVCKERNMDKEYDSVSTAKSLITNEIVEPVSLTYIRGRSIPKQLIIVDEVQNLTPHEVKTIVSRAGEGTKVILIGDPYQIDNPYLDENSNGLSYVTERMKDNEVHGHVTMIKVFRSTLAQAAVERL